ncbi:GH43 endo-1,4-beta-xylosidase/arabinosidase [Trichoderma parareesei]|uniref:GH43 endo-1,4-beta-xylosidase/arabinosidase n=1 Tax=Trichoderma parareesei TaxID=858221 RepID=A0A2H2ZTG0_TRIPA|nr:GH43 endo-1,4-beta-xylosidase/arabinosidase [Trichoderma parareesei]
MQSRRVQALLAACWSSSCLASISNIPDFATSEAGNPFVDGWYADPDTQFYNGEYWVYPTSSRPYDEQTYLDAFSSPDLVHWTKHSNILTADDFTWAHRAVWAPAPIYRNGTYYLYFGANDIQSDSELGGIGVGVAERPEGPYTDPLGHPLVDAYHNGAQPIDQDVFIDDDGQAYMYYGGHSHANIVKLNDDMISLSTFDDGTTFKEITPENYVEGPQMLKRNGVYYLFWSEGGWTGPDYAVSYGMSSSPLGPFDRIAKILQQDEAVATGSGHNAVIQVPDTDIYYILYHRHPLGSTDGNDRHLAYDRLYFNDDGTIEPVKMLVHDNFEDGNMIGWATYGGSGDWDASANVLRGNGGLALVNTNFSDFTYEADVQVSEPKQNDCSCRGHAGIVFRASEASAENATFKGYYAGISTSGALFLSRVDGAELTVLASEEAGVATAEQYRLKVTANGSSIQVAVNDEQGTTIRVTDEVFGSGMDGVRIFKAEAEFDNVNITRITSS